MQIIAQKLGKYISVHHARFEMFSALMHIVTVGEGVLTSVHHFLEQKKLIHTGRE